MAVRAVRSRRTRLPGPSVVARSRRLHLQQPDVQAAIDGYEVEHAQLASLARPDDLAGRERINPDVSVGGTPAACHECVGLLGSCASESENAECRVIQRGEESTS
jgi:hypothetical protein